MYVFEIQRSSVLHERPHLTRSHFSEDRCTLHTKPKLLGNHLSHATYRHVFLAESASPPLSEWPHRSFIAVLVAFVSDSVVYLVTLWCCQVIFGIIWPVWEEEMLITCPTHFVTIGRQSVVAALISAISQVFFKCRTWCTMKILRNLILLKTVVFWKVGKLIFTMDAI